jgi:hypothetical protein
LATAAGGEAGVGVAEFEDGLQAVAEARVPAVRSKARSSSDRCMSGEASSCCGVPGDGGAVQTTGARDVPGPKEYTCWVR